MLWLSSPIGLGHIQRDIAIAQALRATYPDVSVDFLAADPARRVVELAGERVHPATDLLMNESAHFEGWARDHKLHAFNALWDMDEIMAANFMTFADVVERERYDLWVGDEGWDLDYFLHENPELKKAPYAFLTDFLGMLPMRDDPASTESAARLGEERGEHRSPAAAPGRPRPLADGGGRGRRPRSGVRAGPPEHAAVGARALPLLRVHVPLRPARVRRPGGPPDGARLPRGER